MSCIGKQKQPDLEVLKEYPSLLAVIDGRVAAIDWTLVRRELLDLLSGMEK